ncbi:transmembrane protein, putative [Bodo saltans]|uniref:Protein ARV n=1 Tax=Bodo saltans TaxID=75058 RepID=A0A0S4J0J7_BODSA|nr:transmembrane protein, putative [Bodo saltans]|eukprot:CUG44509.1 transmembrane protein, putative [Bodo saltans]
MPRCTNCDSHVAELVRTEQGVLVVVRCSHCDTQCDPYLELVGVQKCLDVFLLRKMAWSHIVHNLKDAWRVLVPLVFLCVVLETYTAEVIESYSQLLRVGGSGTSLTEEGFWQHPTLKIVDNLQPARNGLVIHLGAMCEAYLYGLLEYIFVTLTITWGCSWSAMVGGGGSDGANNDAEMRRVLGKSFSATAVLWSVKLVFALFLLWDIPLYLVVAVDALSILWLLRAVRTIAPRSTVTSSLIVCALAVGARFGFRGVTRWCPLYLTADLLMGTIPL